jgi:hypothetical protein
VLAQGKPEEGHQLLGVLEPGHIPDFGRDGHGDDQGDAPEGLQHRDQARQRPARHELADLGVPAPSVRKPTVRKADRTVFTLFFDEIRDCSKVTGANS